MKKYPGKEYMVPMESDVDLSQFHYQPGCMFSDETMESFEKLGVVLRKIHYRLIKEGYTIDHEKGIFCGPDGKEVCRRNK